MLDTLAAAYAEAGRFADAVQTAKKALELATQQEARLVASIQARLRLYQARTPFRDLRQPPARATGDNGTVDGANPPFAKLGGRTAGRRSGLDRETHFRYFPTHPEVRCVGHCP